MARTFTAASSQSLDRDVALFSAPMSLGCWFNSDDAAAGQALISLSTAAANTNSLILYARGDVAGDPVQLNINDGAGDTVNSTTGYSVNTWHHACGVIASATDRRVFIDGGSKATTTVSRSPTVDRFSVGRFGGLASGSFMSGRIAEVALWNAALDDAEVAALGKGFCPLLIRPQSLVGYWPLFGNDASELDRWKNRYDLTVTGATKGDHARIYYPVGPWITQYPAAASGGNMFLVW